MAWLSTFTVDEYCVDKCECSVLSFLIPCVNSLENMKALIINFPYNCYLIDFFFLKQNVHINFLIA